jgi:hypothetical protein
MDKKRQQLKITEVIEERVIMYECMKVKTSGDSHWSAKRIAALTPPAD